MSGAMKCKRAVCLAIALLTALVSAATANGDDFNDNELVDAKFISRKGAKPQSQS